MAIEAAPHPGLETQQHEEFIDYSEDDSAAPVISSKGSNSNSFSSTVKFVVDPSENPEELLSNTDHQSQAIDLQVEADSEAISVIADTHFDGDGADFFDADDTEAANQLDATETDGGYFDDTENPGEAKVTEHEGIDMNENEISWEDGPSNEQDAEKDNSNKNNDIAKPINDDWQLVGEGEHAVHDATNSNEDVSDHGEAESHETDHALEVHSNASGNLAEETEATSGVNVDPVSGGEQAAGSYDSKADGDVNEIEYPEDQDIDNSVDASQDGHDARADGQNAIQEGLGNAASKQVDAEDHVMGEDFESQLEQVIEGSIAETDGVNEEHHDSEVADVPVYAAPDEETSDREHVVYDDEMLADARSSVSAETPSNEDMDIPVITVSYKGIDYPFFYGAPDSEGKECFFNDLSLLHCKMEGVLAGFRRELASELGPLDELVFQIDELGLEFAESTQSDVFSDITLGQIISVFDSLVKNQNPDASKPLYAYLSTRPNCKKRWLSLVDDAYNGKGLDEISFYFASRAQSEAPEIIDDDEPDLIGEEDNADAAAWPQSPGESEHGDQDDVEVQRESAEINEETNDDNDVGDGIAVDDGLQPQGAVDKHTLEPDASAAEDVDAEATMVDTEVSLMDDSATAEAVLTVEAAEVADVAEDQQPQHHEENGNTDCFLSTPCFRPNFCLCITCASSFNADQMVEEDSLRYESMVQMIRKSAQRQMDFVLDYSHLDVSRGHCTRVAPRHLHSHSDVSMAFSSTTDADITLQALEVDISNPLVWDAEEADAFTTAEDTQPFLNDEDLMQNLNQIAEGVDGISADKVTPNTSATSTLNGDEEVNYDNELDINADLPEDEIDAPEVPTQDDELAEIDWREFPGQDDGVAKSPSISSKRPRSDVDDVLDDEAQKDVKRRRS
ncbi:Conserved glutamic acid-rich protein [Colletotrichum higginsianum IMI 349063]|uniref:Conserved glutamic acid-rich protein n=1 Tax=Colletotrichum higginsianum (strain IMI 349063) TaxID=759273 RepID=A0A1B7YPU7_COLHI|nr:Conserved glutamic acid-rich protein [Colletotrichum higginsianum IMI 349063]OBR14065.1 Conserved glutamic acid-rich protein [Colletotrichum higginsianum IMI 349063]